MTNDEVEALVALTGRIVMPSVVGWICIHSATSGLTSTAYGAWESRIEIGTDRGGIKNLEQAIARLGEMIDSGAVTL